MSFRREIDRMYVKGMQYLAEKQNELRMLGRTDSATSRRWWVCAMLSILAHGEDPNYGPYKDTVHKALDFILKSQDAENGLHRHLDV